MNYQQRDLFAPTDVERKFEAFDDANPQVWSLFCEFAFDLIDKGARHYSARDIFPLIRWRTFAQTNDGQGFKINNNYSPFYARKFARSWPEHKDFFEFRRSEADEAIPRATAHSSEPQGSRT